MVSPGAANLLAPTSEAETVSVTVQRPSNALGYVPRDNRATVSQPRAPQGEEHPRLRFCGELCGPRRVPERGASLGIACRALLDPRRERVRPAPRVPPQLWSVAWVLLYAPVIGVRARVRRSRHRGAAGFELRVARVKRPCEVPCEVTNACSHAPCGPSFDARGLG